MQEFLVTDKVNCNLMSLTGYRTLVLFSLLLEGPKSIDEINDYFAEHKYINESFSKDTLRVYLNSLRTIGCDISRADKTLKNKYVMQAHPFELNIGNNVFTYLKKLYSATYTKLSIDDLIKLDNLFLKLSNNAGDKLIQENLLGISKLKTINKSILKELKLHCAGKHRITFIHNSQNSGEQEIEMQADKLDFRNHKLYVFGYSITHKSYSFFHVSNIKKIISIKINSDNKETSEIRVKYEIKNTKNINENEKIIEVYDDKIVVEAVSNSRFTLMQDILSLGADCKVLSPEDFKSEIISKIKATQEGYQDD